MATSDSAWHFPSHIPGWLELDEGRALAELAAGKVVLELGSYCGRSTICMVQTASIVHSIDWHQGDQHCGPQNSLALFMHYTRPWRSNIVVHVGHVDDVCQHLAPASFDFALVDTAHDFESVQRDLKHALRLLKPSATLAVHDVGYPEVHQACNSIIPCAPLYVVRNLGIFNALT